MLLGLNRRDTTRDRNDHWRWAVDRGLPDPYSGIPVKRSVAYLANLFGVTRQAVRNGIAESRQRLRAIEDAAIP